MSKKSDIMKMYNALRNDAKYFNRIEPKRLNKALGIAMKTSPEPSKYYTTLTSCTCPDTAQRGIYVCKHRLALIMQNTDITSVQRAMGTGIWEPEPEELQKQAV